MNILIVGNIIKDVYLNLDSRTEKFEVDQNDVKWLNISFDASEHKFFNRNSSLGGAAVSFEVLHKLGIDASVSDQPSLQLTEDGFAPFNSSGVPHRYILVSDGSVSYLAPSVFQATSFVPPVDSADYLFIDRSVTLDEQAVDAIQKYLDSTPQTKLVTFLQNPNNPTLTPLINRAALLFIEQTQNYTTPSSLSEIDPKKIIYLSETRISYLGIFETITPSRIDMSTHLSTYSIAAATILGAFVLGHSVEDSLALAKINIENSKLNSTLSLSSLQKLAKNRSSNDDIELIAANLVLKGKGILAADESGGSIQKKFANQNIPDTETNRRDYRNIFFTTPDLEKHVNGVILFDETSKQMADDGRTFVEYLISRRVIPGIKVDQGLEKFANSEETYTKGLEGIADRLQEYYARGLRFAKWRAAFEIRLDDSGTLLTPTDHAITENCRILAEYAKECQSAGLVPIVEPEVVYDGNYSIEKSIEVTSRILDMLFEKLADYKVNLSACILKVNMILAGKQFDQQSTPEEVGVATAKVLKEHVPDSLAGVVFLSGGQTVEQATDNLAQIIANGPFPWPVTFSFARALQDPALYTWQGDNNKADEARQAFLERLIANTDALKTPIKSS